MGKVQIPKIRTKIEVKNEVSKDETDLYLYGTISSYSWWDEETVTAKNVRNKLMSIKTSKINVHINSGGGDVFESIAIHNLLKNHSAEIVIYIDGWAASGASVIAMAGDKIIMPKNTMMMIHKAWTYTAGNADELRKVATDLDKMDTAVLESYTSRFVGEKEELQELLAEETWLTSEECKEFGFCDEVADEIEIPEEDPEEDINNKSAKEKILAKYKSKVAAQANENHEEGKKPTTKIENGKVISTFLQSFK